MLFNQLAGSVAITGARLWQKIGCPRHAFSAASEIELPFSALQPLHGRYDRLQTTSAYTIDGLGRYLFGKTGFESNLTARIHAAARLQNIADNHVGDIFGDKSGQDRLGCNNTQVNRRNVLKTPLKSSNCRALGCCNNELWHKIPI